MYYASSNFFFLKYRRKSAIARFSDVRVLPPCILQFTLYNRQMVNLMHCTGKIDICLKSIIKLVPLWAMLDCYYRQMGQKSDLK